MCGWVLGAKDSVRARECAACTSAIGVARAEEAQLFEVGGDGGVEARPLVTPALAVEDGAFDPIVYNSMEQGTPSGEEKAVAVSEHCGRARKPLRRGHEDRHWKNRQGPAGNGEGQLCPALKAKKKRLQLMQ